MKRKITAVELPQGVWLGLECGHPNPCQAQTSGVVDCRGCDHRRVPRAARPGRRTPVFDHQTVPPALLRAHQTSAWAELVVTRGTVEFYDEDPPWHATATPTQPIVIVPNRAHHVEPAVDAQFAVQFYDLPMPAERGARS